MDSRPWRVIVVQSGSTNTYIHVLFEESLSRYNSNNKTSSELTLCSKIVNIQQE
jgi:hypothetical protein